MNIHKSQLFWCEQKGYKVLTHCHIELSSAVVFSRPPLGSPGPHGLDQRADRPSTARDPSRASPPRETRPASCWRWMESMGKTNGKIWCKWGWKQWDVGDFVEKAWLKMLKLPRKFEVSWSIFLIVCWSSNIWGFDWTGLWFRRLKRTGPTRDHQGAPVWLILKKLIFPNKTNGFEWGRQLQRKTPIKVPWLTSRVPTVRWLHGFIKHVWFFYWNIRTIKWPEMEPRTLKDSVVSSHIILYCQESILNS